VTEPERRPAPEPLETDEVRVIAVGTALFAIGLLVALLLHDRLDDDGRADWVWIMVCGLLLGLIGIRIVRRRRDALRRGAADDPSDGRTDPHHP
jgi:hypothetical protein